MKPEIKAANKAYSEKMPMIKRRSEKVFQYTMIVLSIWFCYVVYQIVDKANF